MLDSALLLEAWPSGLRRLRAKQLVVLPPAGSNPAASVACRCRCIQQYCQVFLGREQREPEPEGSAVSWGALQAHLPLLAADQVLANIQTQAQTRH